MTLRITCPGCKTALALDDDARGRKIRCRQCEKVLSIPAADGGRPPHREQRVSNQENLNQSAQSPPAGDDQGEDDLRRAKKKKKKRRTKGEPANMLLIAGIAVIGLGLVGVAGGLAYFLLTRTPTPPVQEARVKVEEKPEKQAAQIIPGIKEGNPALRSGGVINSVRGAAYRTDRINELRNIGLAYHQFLDETKPNERTYDNFLKSISSFGPIRDAVKEGYYQMNMKAGHESDSIICYEKEMDTRGYLCVRGDGRVEHVPPEQWKKALGMP